MPGNTFGLFLKLTTFGESHGEAIGGILDGFPAGFKVDFHQIQADLNRRKPGQSKLTTQRKEPDEVQFLSGIFEGKTTGTPIGFIIPNVNSKSKDYSHLKGNFRPSHADFTYQKKYGIRDYRGGGRSSARETACRVVAGALAKQFLLQQGIAIQAYVSQVGAVKLHKNYQELDFSNPENEVKCPDAETAKKMSTLILETRKKGDTVGGKITCFVAGVPAGLGEPVFDKLHAQLGKAMLSINAVKGFEYGSGFSSIEMTGSQHNDIFHNQNDKIITKTNNSGGIQGGISNGMDIEFHVAFKPVATLMQAQQSVNEKGEEITLEGKGRHDPCVVPRAVPIVEAMSALTLLDFWLIQKTNE